MCHATLPCRRPNNFTGLVQQTHVLSFMLLKLWSLKHDVTCNRLLLHAVHAEHSLSAMLWLLWALLLLYVSGCLHSFDT